MNRIARKPRCPTPGPKVGSLWTCDACADDGTCCEIVTTPGGPAPRCKNADRHGYMRYRGGRYVAPEMRLVNVTVEKGHDKD